MWSSPDVQFDQAVSAAASTHTAPPVTPVTDTDLLALPAPVARYLRRCGVVHKPRVHNFVVDMHAELNRGPGQTPMQTPVLQISWIDPTVRLFLLHTTMHGLPVQGLHAFDPDHARMDIRVLGHVPVAREHGDAFHRAEMVTVLNDWCIMAPAALLDARLTWRAISDHQAGVTFTHGTQQVTADLTFDDDGDLVDFASTDRHAREGDGERWTTPLRFYRDFGAVRVASQGDAIWHYPDRDPWTYGTFTLQRVRYNVPEAELPTADMLTAR